MKNSITVILAIIGFIHFSHVAVTSGFPESFSFEIGDSTNITTTTTASTTTPAPGNDTTTTPEAPGNDTTTTPETPGNETTTAPVVPGNETTTAPVAPGNETTTTPDVPGNMTTTEAPSTTDTTPSEPPVTPAPHKGKSKGSSFDGGSFAGGIALGFGLMIIAGIAYTLYRRRAQIKYNAM